MTNLSKGALDQLSRGEFFVKEDNKKTDGFRKEVRRFPNEFFSLSQGFFRFSQEVLRLS